ncbi:MAG: CoA-acylating methylmalonate-semialdehyde dehydrogenase [Bacteroidetes bacterium]|nr:CoA-acylating methylmalonate-semialdehyde dehydrogenase [Bacteroidota bacterium]
MKHVEADNFINGKFIRTERPRLNVYSPLDGMVISTVPLCGYNELEEAVIAAKNAFPKWSGLTSKKRSEVLYRYHSILLHHISEIAAIIHDENGKAIAEVEKSIELTEFACSIPQITAGEILKVSEGVVCQTEYTPLGVVASICPFNFPHMVPHWTIPTNIALGNCIILKPSEQVPVTALKIAEMLKEAGLPDGVLNIVHGDKTMVEAICDHPGIKAVSFVGSTEIAKVVYRRSTTNLKRCLALGGAKNHLIVFPDADPEMTATDITASFSGTSGQRCMAASVMIAIGNVDHIIEKLCNETRKVKPGLNLGPIISQTSKEKIIKYIDRVEKSGAKILIDGRNAPVEGEGDKNGYYIGPTIIEYSYPGNQMPQEEVFGPVFEIVHVKSLDEAIALENNSPYGNAASAFTQNGGLADEVAAKASAGMIGINIGVPVPREPFSFGGWNDSKFGTGDLTGKGGIEFWTQLKKITKKWKKQERTDWMS